MVNGAEQSGNGDAVLNPGEFFTYTCEMPHVTFSPTKSFPDDKNQIVLSAKQDSTDINLSDQTEVNSNLYCGTSAPSELQTDIDQPYINCRGNGDPLATHYRYRLTKILSAEAPFISDIKVL